MQKQIAKSKKGLRKKNSSQILKQEPKEEQLTGFKLLNQLQSVYQMSIVPYGRLVGYGLFVDITENPANDQLSVAQAREAKKLGSVIYLRDSYNGCHILAPSDIKRLNLAL